MQAMERMASVVSSTLPTRRRLIRSVCKHMRWGRQIPVAMSEPAEELFLQFLRRTASIRIFVSRASQPELLCLDRLPPRKSGERRFFLWNTDYPWTPDIAVASNGASYIRDIDSAPVIEYDRDPLTLGCYDSHRGRIFWRKGLTPGGSYFFQNAAYTYSYDAEQFAGWYSQAVHWIKKNSKPVKLKNGDIQYRVNSPSPWWKFW